MAWRDNELSAPDDSAASSTARRDAAALVAETEAVLQRAPREAEVATSSGVPRLRADVARLTGELADCRKLLAEAKDLAAHVEDAAVTRAVEARAEGLAEGKRLAEQELGSKLAAATRAAEVLQKQLEEAQFPPEGLRRRLAEADAAREAAEVRADALAGRLRDGEQPPAAAEELARKLDEIAARGAAPVPPLAVELARKLEAVEEDRRQLAERAFALATELRAAREVAASHEAAAEGVAAARRLLDETRERLEAERRHVVPAEPPVRLSLVVRDDDQEPVPPLPPPQKSLAVVAAAAPPELILQAQRRGLAAADSALALQSSIMEGLRAARESAEAFDRSAGHLREDIGGRPSEASPQRSAAPLSSSAAAAAVVQLRERAGRRRAVQ